jgi:hypothetical protein
MRVPSLARLCGYPFVGLIVFCKNRLLNQPSKRGFSRCTIECIGRPPELLAVKQALNVAGHCVGRHYEKGIDSVYVASGDRAARVPHQSSNGRFREPEIVRNT